MDAVISRRAGDVEGTSVSGRATMFPNESNKLRFKLKGKPKTLFFYPTQTGPNFSGGVGGSLTNPGVYSGVYSELTEKRNTNLAESSMHVNSPFLSIVYSLNSTYYLSSEINVDFTLSIDETSDEAKLTELYNELDALVDSEGVIIGSDSETVESIIGQMNIILGTDYIVSYDVESNGKISYADGEGGYPAYQELKLHLEDYVNIKVYVLEIFKGYFSASVNSDENAEIESIYKYHAMI